MQRAFSWEAVQIIQGALCRAGKPPKYIDKVQSTLVCSFIASFVITRIAGQEYIRVLHYIAIYFGGINIVIKAATQNLEYRDQW